MIGKYVRYGQYSQTDEQIQAEMLRRQVQVRDDPAYQRKDLQRDKTLVKQ